LAMAKRRRGKREKATGGPSPVRVIYPATRWRCARPPSPAAGRYG
jgi:hypothetical protein